MSIDYVEILGYIAACFSTFAMLPQAIHIYQTGEVEQLSLRAFTMATTGAILWLAYGLMLKNNVIIWANLLGIVIVGYIFIKKLRWQLHHRNRSAELRSHETDLIH